MDDFYDPLGTTPTSASGGLFTNGLNLIFKSPVALLVTLFLAPLLVIIATRVHSGYAFHNARTAGNTRKVEMVPYWIPVIGHAFQFFYDPIQLMRQARDQSLHGIFSLNMGATTHNIISNPTLVKGIMQQKESVAQFDPIGMNVVIKFFGVPARARPKYELAMEDFNKCSSFLMKEPHLSNMLRSTLGYMEQNIPQMLSFTDKEIDRQPWERRAKASFISVSEVEVNLMAILRHMMGHSALPGIFGNSLLEKYPDLLHDIYEMDKGLMYFIMGLPAWTPIPKVYRPHLARQRCWEAMDDFQTALDANAAGKPDQMWGDLDDVSAFILARHKVYQKHDIPIKERADLSMAWAIVINANLLVYWHLLYILSTPGLIDRICSEVSPYVKIDKPLSIGNFSEAPKLKIDHEGLAKKCHLFKSTYFEALRMCGQPWSMRSAGSDIIISTDKKSSDPKSFTIKKGEFITVPHDLHMRDPAYFPSPDTFNPERFLVHNPDGTLSTDMGTIRPYGGGPSMCKGRVFAERECLACVAGVLMMWDFKPVGGRWTIPDFKKTTGIALPVIDTRVRVTKREFAWDT